MEEEYRRYIWHNYTADLIGMLTERFCRYTGADNCSIPLYSEVIEPEKSKKDSRTAEEIKNHVLQRLSE